MVYNGGAPQIYLSRYAPQFVLRQQGVVLLLKSQAHLLLRATWGNSKIITCIGLPWKFSLGGHKATGATLQKVPQNFQL